MLGKLSSGLDIAIQKAVEQARDTRNIDAILKDGVLTLNLLKAPEAKPREIQV